MVREASAGRLAWAVHISLLSGLLLSASLLVLGAVLTLRSHESTSDHQPAGFASIVSRAASGDGVAIIDLGILVMMLTPLSRVLVLAIGWLMDREWRFGLIAFFVLALLVASLILGTG